MKVHSCKLFFLEKNTHKQDVFLAFDSRDLQYLYYMKLIYQVNKKQLSSVLFSIYTAETVGGKYRKATAVAYTDDIAIYSNLISAETKADGGGL